MKDEIYIADGEEPQGPYTLAQVKAMWSAGSLTGQWNYWREGMGKWLPLVAGTPGPESRPLPAIGPPPLPVRSVSTLRYPEPPFIGMMILTLVIPISGIIIGCIWLGEKNPKYKTGGQALIGLSGILLIVYGLIAFALE